ncbi:HpcH/HpaI aldolase/citrate lyase family protein [Halocatena pleomorpha]|uniref:CoA ester lyase n=1 Tax=Halocatena pleomorpha TaxID=1785090 RepID=A0A3P3R581_9EURY|nr:CoA ester lyase [Halocatena pleomorpha]RRJ28632.1 CoA ester lyase [Halocatena pleomorpha]
MPRRSVLFSPGDRPELMRKAPQSGADVVVFDLEDAVGPENKSVGREAVAAVVGDPAFDPDCAVCVRVTDEPQEDLAVLANDSARLDLLMLPKTDTSSDVTKLAASCSEVGIDVPVCALCETARGVLNAPEIAAAEPTAAIAFGAEDLAADIGANRTEEGTEVLYARERVVLAASAAGIDAIDTVFTDIDDTEGLAAATETARDLGYTGKMAIHPYQVPVINDGFTPSEEQIEWAQRVLDARDEHEGGVFRLDDEMIDAPLIARAENILERTPDSQRS